MAFSPIALTIPQYDVGGSPAAGHWMKGYAQGTTTDLTMYQDAAGSTSMTRAELNADGMPVTAGNVRFIPHFGQAYDLWLFPTAAAADADDTSGAIQLADNGILISARAEAPIIKLTVAAMVADATIVAGDIVKTLEHTSGRGYRGGNLYLARAVTGADADNGSIIKSTGNTAIEFVGLFPEGPNVKQFGAAGDGSLSTNDSAAFDNCKTYARTINAPVLVPQSGGFYRLLTEYVMDQNGDELTGEGWGSTVILGAASSGFAISVKGAQWFKIRNLMVSGVAATSGGIRFIYNSGHCANGVVEGVNVAYTGGDCYRLESCVSVKFINCYAEMNGGFRPAGLNAVAGSLGSPNHNWWIAGATEISADTTMNDIECIGCQSNGGGATYGVRVGSASNIVETFNWVGGLMQGAGSNRELYAHVRYGSVRSAHFESNALTSGAYSVTLDNCSNFRVEDCLITGAILISGTSDLTGVRDVHCAGIRFDSTVDDTCYAERTNVITGNGDGGPTNGHVYDFSGNVGLRNMVGNRNYGDNLGEQGKVWFATDFTDWVGTTLPCGFNETGGGTASQETTIRLGGTYSCQFDATGTSDFLYHVIHREGDFSSEKIVVEAWVYNVTTVSLTTMTAYYNGGATSISISTRQADAWERMLATFDIPASTTSINIRFGTSAAGTFYLGRFVVKVPNWYDHLHERTLDNAATPDLKGDEGWVPEIVRSGGTTTITSFLNPIVGREFRFIADHAVTINDTATINLSGAANQALTVGSSMSFVYDGTLFTETGRMIV